MTYKDFVAKAVIAMLSNPRVINDSNVFYRNDQEEIVRAAYTFAYLIGVVDRETLENEHIINIKNLTKQ